MMKNNRIIILVKDNQKIIEKALKYSFKQADIITVPESYTPFDREKLATKINNDYTQVVFYGYYDQFYLLLPLINKKVIKKYILDVGIAEFAEQYIFTNFQQIIEYKERGLIDYIATIRYDLYIAFKDSISYIKLDYKSSNKQEDNDSVGILNEYYLENSNFYNQLSGIALSKIKKATVLNQDVITKKFGEDFEVEIDEEKDIEKLIYKNRVNLDCRFCDVSDIYFLMSMDAEIPCILGNTNLLDNCEELKKYLVLKCDDDVNEIKDKIEICLEKAKEINKLYLSWKKDYSNYSKKTIDDFTKLGGC